MTTEKLKLARDALESCQTIGKWASPALDADYIKKQSYDEAKVADALAAIAADTAPAAASVECQAFHELAMDYRAARSFAQTPYEALVAYVNAWGAVQREEGQKEAKLAQLAARPAVDVLLRSRVADLLHLLEHLPFSSDGDLDQARQAMADVRRMLPQDKPAAPSEAAMKDWRAMYEGAQMQICDLEATLAVLIARMTGSADEMPTQSTHPGDVSKSSEKIDTIPAAPVAPVSDGNMQKKFEAWAYDKYPIGGPDRGLNQYANSGTQQAWEIWKAISAALTQQKG